MEHAITKHFENIQVALTMGLQRGIFPDFETAVAIKNSLDAVGQYIKSHVGPPAPTLNGETPATVNHLQTEA